MILQFNQSLTEKHKKLTVIYLPFTAKISKTEPANSDASKHYKTKMNQM